MVAPMLYEFSQALIHCLLFFVQYIFIWFLIFLTFFLFCAFSTMAEYFVLSILEYTKLPTL